MSLGQEIRFLTRPDGVRLAYSVFGDGPPLLVLYPWSHIELEIELLPDISSPYEILSGHHTIVRLDRHGSGLSDRDRTDFSLDADVLDVQAIVDHLELDRLAIFGLGAGSAIAVSYAAHEPERVSDLILMRAYARGETMAPPAVRKALEETIEAHWGLGSRTLAALMVPDSDPEVVANITRFNRESVTAETAGRMLRASYEHELTDLAPRVRARTLIIQGKRDPFLPFSAGRELAALIPDCRLVAVERGVLLSLATVGYLTEFLGDPRAAAAQRPPVTVFVTDRERSTDLTHELGDEPAHELQRIHDRVVRESLRRHGGKENKHTGDGIMATFASPSAAITCAIDVQHALAPHDDVRVRIGLAAGEVVEEHGDIFGSTVQLACRVRDRARAGQILVPEAVRQLAGVKGFRFGDARSVTLKGFPERVRLYEVAWEEVV